MKLLVAPLLRIRTAAATNWIAQRLSMGCHDSVSRIVVAASKEDAKHESELKKLIKMLIY